MSQQAAPSEVAYKATSRENKGNHSTRESEFKGTRRGAQRGRCTTWEVYNVGGVQRGFYVLHI